MFADSYELANIVCFVKFADQSDDDWEHDTDYYDQLFNSVAKESGEAEESVNSVRNYFYDMSYGNLTWESIILPVVYTDTHTRSYFLPKSSDNPDGYSNLDLLLDTRIKSLVRDACAFLTEKLQEIDPREFDRNGDNEIDNLTLIICGNSDISGSRMLWPANNRGASAYIGGLKVGNYLKVFDGANGYKSLKPQKINTGVLCHEMMHTLGAYDLYTTKGNDNSALEPVNVWDLMSDNKDVPQGLTAHVRSTYGKNWLPKSSIETITEDGYYTVRPLSSPDAKDVAFIIRPDKARSEYFMVEYRDRKDIWDSSLPFGGLLVYRVNPAVTQTGNLGKDFELYIFRPKGSTSEAGIIARAPLGSETKRYSFGHIDDQDYPFYSDGTRAQFCITDLKETEEGMNFKLSFDITAATVEGISAEEDTPRIYDLRGLPVTAPLAPGIYISVEGNKTRKIIVR